MEKKTWWLRNSDPKLVNKLTVVMTRGIHSTSSATAALGFRAAVRSIRGVCLQLGLRGGGGRGYLREGTACWTRQGGIRAASDSTGVFVSATSKRKKKIPLLRRPGVAVTQGEREKGEAGFGFSRLGQPTTRHAGKRRQLGCGIGKRGGPGELGLRAES
jgi:hypothetical protein